MEKITWPNAVQYAAPEMSVQDGNRQLGAKKLQCGAASVSRNSTVI